jgi:hypothetical protein
MSLKSIAAKIFAQIIYNKTQKWVQKPIETQQKVFQNLIASADFTQFGKDHHFKEIKSFEDFAKQVPIRDYEALLPYIDRVVKKIFYGKENLFILPKLQEQLRALNIFR